MDDKTLAELRAMGAPMDLSEVENLVRLYLYGDFGVGKTDLAVKIVQVIMEVTGKKTIWLTTDSGWTTVKKYPEVSKNVWKQDFDSFKQIRLLCQAHDEGIEPFVDYGILVVDTVGKAIDMMLRYLVKAKPLDKEQYDEMLEARGHYRMVEQLLKDTVEVVNKSKMHVIYTSHIRFPNEDDRKNRKFSIRPDAPEASFKVIARESNAIGWLYKDAGKRLIQFEPTLKETAKIQIPGFEEKTYPVEEIPDLIRKFLTQ